MLEWLANPEIWIALGTLTALEIVLGIDNIIFLSVLVEPPSRTPTRRRTPGRPRPRHDGETGTLILHFLGHGTDETLGDDPRSGHFRTRLDPHRGRVVSHGQGHARDS